MQDKNPFISPVKDSTTPITGIWLLEDIEGLKESIDSHSWVDATIGGITTGLDALSTAMDPLGALASMAIGWLMEHVKPLKEALDKLTGNADVVNSYATTWNNVAVGLGKAAHTLQGKASSDTPHWNGKAADAYGKSIDHNIQGIGGIAGAAAAMASATEGAGMLVATVRAIVRQLIADCVATLLVRVPEWLAEEGLTLGIGTPWVAGQVSSLVMKWVGRITAFTQALITSIRSLTKLIG